MKKLSVFFLILVASLSLVLVGCGKKDPNVIRVNEVTHSIFYAPFYVAINKGYFADEGITIELTNGGGSDKSMTALVSGSADIALLGAETAVYVAAEGRQDLPVIFGQLTKRDGSFLMGRTAVDGRFDWTSLRSSTVIGGRTGGLPAMTLEYVLKSYGLNRGIDYTFDSDVAFANMAAAFQSGYGDYVTLFEPTASDMRDNGNGHILASVGKESGEVPYTAFMANSSYISANRDKVKAFLRAVVRGYNFIMNATTEQVAEALRPSFAGSSIENIRASVDSYKAIDAWVSSPAMQTSAYENLLTIMRSAGQLTTAVPFSKIVDNSIALEVMGEM